ncbi:helix-turn-helix domain-containing protein [Celeribacter indicus]|uniref:AraC family transcriptional regulator n=1 Tax=Celeribacter indicus TaxID=1208324 RepID=A0A0B5DQZ0_9RHOB|nr:helix-turn-helix domain-containing protein [Celeribacter indicus]AJE45509.1 AraC family transcriptional regulator [Celeribacter indicus]SDW87200.1 transcriptional regulator, AraC family [Celeribacter indicus]
MTAATLFQSEILAPGEEFHFSRSVLSRARPKALHDQDYYEIFWLHNGRARLVTEGGRMSLSEGDVVFLSPGLPHGLQGVGEESHIVNIVIRPERIASLVARFPEISSYFPAAGNAPVQFHRDIRHLSRLSSSAKALEAAPRSALYLEAFLLPLIAELASEARGEAAKVPPWLADALIAVESPAVFRDGAAGLVAQCGKAHAHVARTMQACLGQTPSDYVNRLRMDYAARQLKGTPDSLTEIAEEIGIQNMSHFHRLFRTRFGMTPRQYRVKHQKGVVQPL